MGGLNDRRTILENHKKDKEKEKEENLKKVKK